jgi:glucosamine-6-phosphate deaminase
MDTRVFDDPLSLGIASGKEAAQLIKESISENGHAYLVLATGTSQFETLAELLRDKEIDWSEVTMFHLDEYIGLPITHKASFRKYLKERFIDKLPSLRAYHLINGENDPEDECKRLSELINQHTINVLLCGIGENGHLAFNDPPADFTTTDPYIIVDLDEACRKQQFGEGWFPSLNDVPTKAISMSIQQMMSAEHIICSAPDERKAKAIHDCFTGEISNTHPASMLRNHPHCTLYLDQHSARLLNK